VENPGVDLYRQDLYIVDSGTSVSAMQDVLTTMGRIAVKLARNQDIGRPSDAEIHPRGPVA
jgi:glycine reductase